MLPFQLFLRVLVLNISISLIFYRKKRAHPSVCRDKTTHSSEKKKLKSIFLSILKIIRIRNVYPISLACTSQTVNGSEKPAAGCLAMPIKIGACWGTWLYATTIDAKIRGWKSCSTSGQIQKSFCPRCLILSAVDAVKSYPMLSWSIQSPTNGIKLAKCYLNPI